MRRPYTGRSLAEIVRELHYARREREDITRCPVCMSPEREVICGQERHGIEQPSVICLECGAVYLSSCLTPKEYERFYHSFYRRLVSAFWKQPLGPRKRLRDAKLYGLALAAHLRKTLPSPTDPMSILDVGGAGGEVTQYVADEFAKSVSVSVTIVEPNGPDVLAARARSYTVIQGFAERMKLIPHGYDLVLLCRTLEHLRHPTIVLGAIHEAVKQGRHVFVDYVDLHDIAKHRGLRRALQIDHICQCSAGTFYPMMAQAGFVPVGSEFTHGPERGKVFSWRRYGTGSYSSVYATRMRDYLKEEVKQ